MSEPAPQLRFDLPAGAHALFTGKAEGNLSSTGGEGRQHGAQARGRLRDAVEAERLARGHQVHGTHVHRLTAMPGQDAEGRRPADADGQATALDRLALLVLAADCLPVVIAGGGALAAVHAGWKGLAAGVLEEGVRAVRELAPEEPPELAAVLGPCAGPCCYEVGPEVHEALTGSPAPRGPADLPALARQRLLGAGVTRVEQAAICTICDERFFSHRREGSRAGRQGGIAWLS